MVPTRRRVENVLLRVVDETTDVVRQGGEPWGRSLWREVQVRLDDLTDAGHGYGLDADLLLGGISSLTGDCVAWFSDAFDVDAAAELAAHVTAVPEPSTTATSPVPAAPPPDLGAGSLQPGSPGEPAGGQ